MKKVFLMMTAFVMMLSVLTGCSDSEAEKDLSTSYAVSDNGLQYCFYERNDGELPHEGDLLEFQWECRINDTVVLIPNSPQLMRMLAPSYPMDLMEGMAMMHKGDSASFIVDIESTFINLFENPKLPSQYKNTDVMRFEVKMNDFYPESEYWNKIKDMVAKSIEDMKASYPEETERSYAEIQAYFAQNHIAAAPTKSGLYYVVTQKGNGEKPEVGDMVSVHYTGKLLDGSVFDSSEGGSPIVFPIGQYHVIPGWEEGIMMMSKGEKGVLYIPYYLAYGPNGAAPVIPPFATLIFDVELTDIQKVQ